MAKVNEETAETVAKKLSKVSNVKPYRGHTLFKVDKTTLEIIPATIEDSDVTSKDKAGMTVRHKRVVVEEGYAYFSALNKKNVIKKLKQLVDPREVDRLLAELDK